ncbi:hypothetical protein [Leptospira noumeaensis]|nr:hypothetical protein [Leptospira noumeaensis]
MYNPSDLTSKQSFVFTKHNLFIFVIFLLCSSNIFANENEASLSIHDKKGRWNLQWGYNRSSYTQSDINFRGPGYNYTLKDVNAKDKPESFKPEVYLNPSKFEIPQYNLKISYFFTDRFFLAFGQDHMKYVVTPGQPVKYSGYIDPGVIAKNQLALSPEAAAFIYLFPGHVQEMAGYHGGEQTIALTPDILKYEHTDGLNYLFLDFGWITPLYTSSDGLSGISLVSTIGAGPVVCRSDVRVLGKGQNNNFHLSGYGVSGYVATRYEFSRTYFIELGGKGGYIDLTDVLTSGGSNRASQNFGFLELVLSGGIAI